MKKTKNRSVDSIFGIDKQYLPNIGFIQSVKNRATKTENEIVKTLKEEQSEDFKVGDTIDIGGFITSLDKIEYDLYAKIDLYWFWNERGEYKFNVRDGIKKA